MQHTSKSKITVIINFIAANNLIVNLIDDITTNK